MEGREMLRSAPGKNDVLNKDEKFDSKSQSGDNDRFVMLQC